MKIYYISPSTIPSKSANSIHIVNMCEAFSKLDHQVTLFVHSATLNSGDCKEQLEEYYGVKNKHIKVVTLKRKMLRGIEFYLGVIAFLFYLKDSMLFSTPNRIISRNLFGAFLLGSLLRRNVIFETHAPDKGIRKKIQRIVIQSKTVSTVVISGALKRIMAKEHSVSESNFLVLHDAAREGREPMNSNERVAQRHLLLGDLVSFSKIHNVIGYFGQLYAGRGINIICEVAKTNPDSIFLVYGGNDSDVLHYRSKNTAKNLFFLGHLPPSQVRGAMAMMDVLLMPYQYSVSVGIEGVDTAQWMSPMKLFEYMSVGVPIIASDLPVLHEVLEHRKNCIFVAPDKVSEWSEAIALLSSDHELASTISETAFLEYKEKYTWPSRAKQMLDLSLNKS